MTQTPPTPPTPESQRVAHLEKQVADAAAALAARQAELSQARAADPALPDVPSPYEGQAPVVMINGQAVPVAQMGAQSFTIPPVVSVNGQVVSAGQPIDLAALMGPAAAQQVASVLTSLGGGLAGMLTQAGAQAGYTAGMSAPSVTGAASPGPMPFAGTPGEIRPTNIALRWLVALVVMGAIALMIYLAIAN